MAMGYGAFICTTVVYDWFMAREDPQMKIRLPEALKRLVDESAAESGRTLNAEIVHRLEQSYNPAPGQPFDMERFVDLKTDILKDVLELLKKNASPGDSVPGLTATSPRHSTTSVSTAVAKRAKVGFKPTGRPATVAPIKSGPKKPKL
jgi:hypothetical protein